jgi:ketosteroid isomerase-like protein
MECVLADHSDDIVMFDVPPPNDGVRGIDAYRQTWPPFFTWQQEGACFEIVSLDVTAGEDVAFVYALRRCGTPEELERDPGNRLRLTVGLRKDRGQWVITHEHHSFPHKDEERTSVDTGRAQLLRSAILICRRAVSVEGGRPAGRAQLLMHAALEAEVTEFLGRDRHQRRAGVEAAREGSRNRLVTIKTTAGPVELERPKEQVVQHHLLQAPDSPVGDSSLIAAHTRATVDLDNAACSPSASASAA